MKDKFKKNENLDINSEKITLLKKHFPHCFTKEGMLDFKKLEVELSEEVDIVKEGYGLNWLGKSYAKVLAHLASETVISPDVEHNSKEGNINSKNVYIKGDNLDVLKHLVNAYTGKIKMIYIDPPYNTGSDDFAYQDNFKFTPEQLADLANVDIEEAQRILSFTEKKSSSHSAWLTFMYPRLFLARELLQDDGVIYISIDDNEFANLKMLCDEIFSEENFISLFPWKSRTAKSDVTFNVSQDYEWILAYAKTDSFKAGRLITTRKYYESDDHPDNPWRLSDLTKQTSIIERPNSNFSMINPKTGEEYPVNPNRSWAITKDTFKSYYDKGKIVFPGDYDFLNINQPAMRIFQSEEIQKKGPDFLIGAISTELPEKVGRTSDGTSQITELFNNKVFAFPKPVELIEYLIKVTRLKDEDIVLDFFSGSATTAHSVMKINSEDNIKRRYILVQAQEATKENSEAHRKGYKYITDIGIERIQRAAKKIQGQTNTPTDFGFKTFELQLISDQLSKNDLNKMLTFRGSIVSDNTILNEFGKETVLSTWMLEDGHDLSSNIEEIVLGGYTAYKVENTLYLLNGDFTMEDHLKSLIEKIEKEEHFILNKLVLFGYSFATQTIASLKDNMKHLQNGRKSADIHVEVRY